MKKGIISDDLFMGVLMVAILAVIILWSGKVDREVVKYSDTLKGVADVRK